MLALTVFNTIIYDIKNLFDGQSGTMFNTMFHFFEAIDMSNY